MLRRPLNDNQKLVLDALRSLTSGGYLSTVRDVQQFIEKKERKKLGYATVHFALAFLKGRGLAHTETASESGEESKRGYWVASIEE